jgi:hypothetical protein
MLPVETIKAAVYEWLTESQTLPVVWDFQNAPQKAVPFISVNVAASVNKIGAYDEFAPDYSAGGTGGGSVIARRRVLCSINAFGQGAMEQLSQAIDALDKPTKYDKWFYARDLGADAGDIRNLTALKNNRYEQRAQADVNITCVSGSTDTNSAGISDDPGYFDTVIYSSDDLNIPETTITGG